ncbi:MAG TPA: tetratricopeptide repeat protein, partial [Elusimicrobiota bacterium]|nr:tetratricopeptide repeat protein [Elusimicrobiota bacterium]
ARPQSCIARANLAAALADRDALAEAAAQYREAAAICPSAAKVQYAWAGVLLRQGDAAGAEERLAKALEISPDYAPARLALGQIRRRLTAR